MSLVLRVDVDKPYGNANFVRKVFSKFMEDYVGKALTNSPFYLSHQKEFLQFCNQHAVSGYFYYRNCTIPNASVMELMNMGKHHTGFHAENTETLQTFSAELSAFRSKLGFVNVSTFSKHGSGVLKLGKHHYPKYEPAKYLEWSKHVNCLYPSGNGICESADELKPDSNGYYENIFWIELDYRSEAFHSIEQLIEVAKKQRVIILIHPENFASTKAVADEFELLIKRAKEEGVEWETPY